MVVHLQLLQAPDGEVRPLELASVWTAEVWCQFLLSMESTFPVALPCPAAHLSAIATAFLIPRRGYDVVEDFIH